MATTSVLDSSGCNSCYIGYNVILLNTLAADGRVNEKDGVSGRSVEEVVPGLISVGKPADIETIARVDALWEEMNKGVSNQTLYSILNKHKLTVNNANQRGNNNWMKYLGLVPKGKGSPGKEAEQKGTPLPEQLNEGSSTTSTVNETSHNTSTSNWATYLGLAPKKTELLGQNEPQKEPNDMHNVSSFVQNGTSDEAKRLAAAALSAVKDATAAALVRGKVEITEVRDFAGKEIEVKKLVDADSKEASERAKASTSSAVDTVLEQIKKKPKLSVLDKTKMDWGEFKEENKGLEDELDAYKKSSNQYLDKVSFLQRADYREFERERDARLALQAKRRPDM
ncbi:BCNT domain-containing protein [Cephalotus follicularis]|uniref:BCNT domain-containing protein n=1 Tax=Cephalotus follicularis TaxID=3775 RepID=A0A1Q3BUU3_CEPFO|nr:BCNT domain-containing protein [Cephalotus follicularis]